MSDEPRGEGDEIYGLKIPFWIDTDGYTDRDRLMFVCGVEFDMVCNLLDQCWEGTRPIHRENESRIRMLCGRRGLTEDVVIEPHEGYDGCEVWSQLTIKSICG